MVYWITFMRYVRSGMRLVLVLHLLPWKFINVLIGFFKICRVFFFTDPNGEEGVALQPALYVNTRTDVSLKITVHMDVMPLLAVVSYRRFGGKHAATTFGIERNRMITTYQITLRHILQYHNLHCHHYKNLASVSSTSLAGRETRVSTFSSHKGTDVQIDTHDSGLLACLL